MGKMRVIVALLSLSIMAYEADAHFEEAQVMHVGGKVMCQDCTKSWNQWIKGDRPIKGCKVSVTCLDERKRVLYYNSDDTDADGEFDVIISQVVYGKKLKPKDCLVRVVSSPDVACNVATNFGNGRTGVRLRQPNVRYKGMVKYLVGPFYYTTPMCEEPRDPNSAYHYH
ncbi:hypothetical protein Nepgr_011718 [Nepenthes gracilis]|uniref:Pistil-specific extensin-like protein n=1 Tax=Nepenthes gracilis TaxID=150966 RepID=A0AAD3SEW7_NEPGR|nr:hypothetical protein Nepgr_011718 [Nepenthes gracilis]